ncbi:MAG TPA: penicillin-binding protein activator [Xanthobacteraceae bacterium]|jgi:ABC-type branched-subunit amino acid transport system substrate-binding protein
MFCLPQALVPARPRRSWRGALVAGLATLLSACSGSLPGLDSFSSSSPPPEAAPTAEAPQTSIGTGQIKVGLLLPLSAPGNAGLAGQSMRNAAELALSEFNNPNIQLLVKDDAGTAEGAQQATQEALNQGAEIILGPLFAHSVTQAAQVARARNIPVIAFSTDSNVAGRGVYLLSFLPETDVDRIVEYAIAQGRKSFVAMVPDNAYGSVVEAEFKQVVARKGGRVVALERYPVNGGDMGNAARLIAQAAAQADALFLPDAGDGVVSAVRAVSAAGLDLKRLQVIGTGLWDDPRIFAEPALAGGWYPAPDSAGFRAFSTRYRARYSQEPVRTATLAYDAVALVAALVKTQGPRRFAPETLANPSGFAGIDGVFRFRNDGSNQRGLAVLRVTPSGGQVISPAPHAFGSGT